MSLKGLECQAFTLVNSDMCPHPTTGDGPLARRGLGRRSAGHAAELDRRRRRRRIWLQGMGVKVRAAPRCRRWALLSTAVVHSSRIPSCNWRTPHRGQPAVTRGPLQFTATIHTRSRSRAQHDHRRPSRRLLLLAVAAGDPGGHSPCAALAVAAAPSPAAGAGPSSPLAAGASLSSRSAGSSPKVSVSGRRARLASQSACSSSATSPATARPCAAALSHSSGAAHRARRPAVVKNLYGQQLAAWRRPAGVRSQRPGRQRPQQAGAEVHLRFGRMVVSENEAPNILANLV